MLSLTLASTLLLTGANAYQTRFFAESGGLQESTFFEPISTAYNLTDSLGRYGDGNLDSYWSSSYIYGNDGHEYLICSHILFPTQAGVYRASIFDITDPSVYAQFTTLYNNSAITFPKGSFDFEFDDYYFGSANQSDPLGPITTWSTNPTATYNLTYQLTAPIILNGGTGTFQWQLPITVQEWSMPAGQMTGSFNINNKTVTVVPEKSFTWFDRQWQKGAADEWTWFQIHLNSAPGQTGEKLSVWFFPSGYGPEKSMATIRTSPGQNLVLPASYVAADRTWTSPNSNNTYDLEWTVELGDGTVLNISTTRDDQELVDANAFFSNYEGYINVSGHRKGGEIVTGFGLVEIQKPVKAGAA